MASSPVDDNRSQGATSSVPSYARPNVASRLPDYSNQTQENIRAAFQPNNYRTIQSLGQHDLDNGAFKVGATGAKTFTDFAYIASPYDLAEEAKIRDRLEHESKIVGKQPFFGGYNANNSSHELDVGFEYILAPYDGPREAAKQERILAESKMLGRPFVPSGVQKALAKPTRAMLNDAMTGLFRSLSEDWSEAPPTVLSTAEDLIVVYFSMEKIKNSAGVNTYMNNALRRNDIVLSFDLKKVAGAWNRRTADGHVMFTFRPPWVRTPLSVPPEESEDAAASKRRDADRAHDESSDQD